MTKRPYEKVKSHPTAPSGAQREKMNHTSYRLVPMRIVAESLGRVLEHGATKYDDRNWERGLPRTQILDSLQRHIWAYQEGEDIDPDSGLSHVDHIGFGFAALAHAEYHNLPDDRATVVKPTYGKAE